MTATGNWLSGKGKQSREIFSLIFTPHIALYNSIPNSKMYMKDSNCKLYYSWHIVNAQAGNLTQSVSNCTTASQYCKKYA